MKHVGQSIVHFALFSVLVLVHRWLGVFELERIDVESFPEHKVLTVIAVVCVGLGELLAIAVAGKRWKTARRVGATLAGLLLLAVSAGYYEHLLSKLDFPDEGTMRSLIALAVAAFSLCYLGLGLVMESFLSLFLHHGGDHGDGGAPDSPPERPDSPGSDPPDPEGCPRPHERGRRRGGHRCHSFLARFSDGRRRSAWPVRARRVGTAHRVAALGIRR